VLYIKCRTVSY